MAVLFMLFQNSPRSHFFGALAIPAGRLSAFLDMFVLALLFRTDSTHMLFPNHTFLLAQGCPELSFLVSGVGVNAANGGDD